MPENVLPTTEPAQASEFITPTSHNGSPQVPHAPVANPQASLAAAVSPRSIFDYGSDSDENSEESSSEQDDPTFAVRTLDFSNC